MKRIPIARPDFANDEMKLVGQAIRSGWVLQGKFVEELEKRIRSASGTRYAVAVNSGTSALHLALQAAGIGCRDEVIVPSFSFIATANSVVYCLARPVFVDIEKDGYNIDAWKIEECIKSEYRLDKNKKALVNKKTGGFLKAVMPVHQFGFPADMERINNLAGRYGLIVIEDAACALGARYKNKKIGSLGNTACFSFHPRKVLTTAEGGAITTNDAATAGLLAKLRNHGVNPMSAEKYSLLGYNYRMSDIHAALGVAQISRLREMIEKRRAIAKRYDTAFRGIEGLRTPQVPGYSGPIYQSYVLQLGKPAARNRLMVYLKKRGISTRVGNQAIHLEPYYLKHFGKRKLPRTEEALKQTVSLPVFPGLSAAEQDYIISKVLECLKKG